MFILDNSLHKKDSKEQTVFILGDKYEKEQNVENKK